VPQPAAEKHDAAGNDEEQHGRCKDPDGSTLLHHVDQRSRYNTEATDAHEKLKHAEGSVRKRCARRQRDDAEDDDQEISGALNVDELAD